MSVPISYLANVIPGVISSAGNAVDLLGLFITDDGKIPTGGIKKYSSLMDLGEDFDSTTKEYKAAAVYFKGYDNSTQKPAEILFTRYVSGLSTPAKLMGGNIGSIGVEQIKEMKGDLSITIDGIVCSGTPDFSEITTMSDAASAIAKALLNKETSFSCYYSSLDNNFGFQSSDSGKDSTISYATGTLAPQLFLDAEHATISQGSDPIAPADFMDSIVMQTLNWASFTTLYAASTQDKLAFSAWNGNQNNRFLYVDSEAPDLATVDWSTNWLPQVLKLKSSGMEGIYENSDTKLYPAFVMGYLASLDFNRTNGRTVIAARGQGGLAPTDLNGTQYTSLIKAGYNVYTDFAATKEEFNFFQRGTVTGDFKWLDTYANQIWLNANLQLRTIYAFRDNNLIPYNEAGYEILITTWGVQCDLAVNFGAIQTGVKLGADQILKANSLVGKDISNALFVKGYYIDIQDAPASVRIERGSPTCTLLYVDGGSVQQITLASQDIL